MQDYEQLSLFPRHEEKKDCEKKPIAEHTRISEKTLDGFTVASIPFIECDFDYVYSALAEILPKEQTLFIDFPFYSAVVCEMVCAAICHQMNWDFLRDAVYRKTTMSVDWLSPGYLSNISESEVYEMLSGYSKPERIRCEERSKILHNLGAWLSTYNSVEEIFFDKDGILLCRDIVRNNLLKCEAFSTDPEEKKMQLLMQKLSSFDELSGLSLYYQPAIDYHLVRVYLRRGLLIARKKYAIDFLDNFGVERKESTMAAIRQLCSNLLQSISEYTQLNTSIVNQIEWQIGRSVCVQGNPDCFLQSRDAQWVKKRFEVCPFFKTCLARCNEKFLYVNEPKYNGISY